MNNENNPNSIYPKVSNPYYIVAPPYVRTSAGVRVLHLLCHALNKRGQLAYVLLYPALPWRSNQIGADLMTPVVTQEIVQSHFERGLAPIMVYPETIAGNPFGSPTVVRYVLNFPGLLGGDKVYPPEELCFSYGEVLAAHTRNPDNILFLPTIDTRIFYPAPEGQKREGTCFYADKYQVAHKGKLFPITKNSLEITRDRPDSQSPQQIADIFRRSELFYVYENTALAIEAVLCGCPVVFLPNEHLTEMIALKELGKEGYAWGTDANEIAVAKASVKQGAANYLKCYDKFWEDLDKFITLTKQHANAKDYAVPVTIPEAAPVVVPGIFETIRYTIRDRGWAGFVKAVIRKIYKVATGQA